MIMKNPADTSNCQSLKQLLIFQALFIPVGLFFSSYGVQSPHPTSFVLHLSAFKLCKGHTACHAEICQVIRYNLPMFVW